MKRYISIFIAAICGILATYAESVSVANVTIEKGKTANAYIKLTNTATDLVSFQMDLTLPSGITLNKAGCKLSSSRFTDSDQELTIGLQADGSYRLTSTSFALTPISGTSGTIITLKLSASTSAVTGTATLSNIIFATSNSEKVTVADASFKISAVVKATGISLNTPSLTLTSEGQTSTLTATVTPSNATNKSVTWTSSDEAVATVSTSGVVTAVGNGTATITAKTKDGTNLTATCEVTVSYPVYVTNTFTMQCARGYVYGNSTKLVGTTDASQASEFAIVTYEDETYLYDATNKAFVCHSELGWTRNTGNIALESSSDLSKIVKNLSFGETGIDSYPYYLAEGVYNTWLNMDGSRNVYMNTWTNFESGNGGNTYKVETVDDAFDYSEAMALLDAYFHPTATLSYAISDDSGIVFTSDAVPATVGATITELPDEFKKDYCSYTVTPKTIMAGSNTVNVSVTYNLPFEISTSMSDAKWYLMTLRGHYVYYDAENSDVRTDQSSMDNTDAYQWAFFGNPYEGIRVANREAGQFLDNTADYVQLSEEGYSWTLVSLNGTTTFGLYNGSKYVNEQNHSEHHLIYWTHFTDDTGSQFTIEEVPNAIVAVTYELYDVNGATPLTSVTVNQASGSEVAIPTALESYRNSFFDFTTSGTIGNSDCTIKVTRSLTDASIVYPISKLSNNKAYTIVCARGGLSTTGEYLASPCKEALGLEAKPFAIINVEGYNYLYSIDDEKFVTYNSSQEVPLATTVNNGDAIGFEKTSMAKPSFALRFENSTSKYVNSSANYTYGIVINSWGGSRYWDDGNQYIIYEVGDFDPTDAIEMLNVSYNDNGVTDAQYAAANNVIEAEHQYCIYTLVDGTRYYLAADGYLTTTPTTADIYTFHQTTGDNLFRSPGWKLDAYFSNPNLSYGASGSLLPHGHIRLNMFYNRDDWEGQVWYLGDNGCYAVRATNADSNQFGAATFWTVLDSDNDGTPEADYAWEPAFVWRLESDLTVGVEEVKSERLRGAFDLGGRLVNRQSVNRQMPKGVYIVGGKKVIVK